MTAAPMWPTGLARAGSKYDKRLTITQAASGAIVRKNGGTVCFAAMRGVAIAVARARAYFVLWQTQQVCLFDKYAAQARRHPRKRRLEIAQCHLGDKRVNAAG